MGELEKILGGCSLCGARSRRGGAGRALAARGVGAIFAAEPRARSGLAYAAGFAGLAYLFRHSAAALGSEWLGLPWLWLTYAWGAWGPAAMALGIVAASELDRSPGTAGRPQAVLGYLIGLWGTLRLVAETQVWFRALNL